MNEWYHEMDRVIKAVFRYGPTLIKVPIHPASMKRLEAEGLPNDIVFSHGTLRFVVNDDAG